MINKEQKEVIFNILADNGIANDLILFYFDGIFDCFCFKLDSEQRIQICKSIDPSHSIDVFCNPFSPQDHLYNSFDFFDECLEMIKTWAKVMSDRMTGHQYIKKIFISHSSIDENIVSKFVDIILRQSFGYDISEIVYTSRDSTGVQPGQDISNFIKENIEHSNYFIQMISSNYRESEVCMNEMGAAWAFNKIIVPILLPNTPFTSLGWLTTFDKAIRIDNGESLNSLYRLLSRKLDDEVDWCFQREQFIDSLKNNN